MVIEGRPGRWARAAALGAIAAAGPARAQTVARAAPIDAASLRDLRPLLSVGRTLRAVLFDGRGRALWLHASDGLLRVSPPGREGRLVTGAELLLPDRSPAPGWIVVGVPAWETSAAAAASPLAAAAHHTELRFVDPLGPTPPALRVAGPVDRLNVSRDGRVLVATHLADARVFVAPPAASPAATPWIARGRLRVPPAPNRSALSADGARLAVASGRTVAVFDPARLAPVATLRPPPSWCAAGTTCADRRAPADTPWLDLCVAADGGVRAVGGTRVAAVPDAHRLDLLTGDRAARPLAELAGTLQSALFSPDCARVAAVVRDAQGAVSLAVYAVADGGALAQTLLPAVDAQLAWSPDGEALAITTPAGATLFSLRTGDAVAAVPAGTYGGVLDASGRETDLASVPAAARAWLQSEVVGPVRWTALAAEQARPQFARASADGRVAVHASGASLAVLDLAREAPVAHVALSFYPAGLAVAPDASALALARPDGDVEVRSLPDAAVRLTLHAHAHARDGLAWSNDGALLATLGARGVVAAWRTADGAPVGAAPAGGPFGAVVASPEAGSFTLVDYAGSALAWAPLANAAHPTTFPAVPDAPSRRAVDGSVVCRRTSGTVGSAESVLRGADGSVARALPGASHCALSASGDRVAWVGPADVAHVAGLRAGVAAATVALTGMRVTAVALSPDGALLAASDGTTVTLYDVRGRAAPRVIAPTLHVDAMAFSPDGSLFVVMAGPAGRRLAEVWALPATTVGPSGWAPPDSPV